MTIRHTEGKGTGSNPTPSSGEFLQIRWSRQISADLQIVRRLMVAHVVLSIVLIVAGIILTLRARP